jgi:hypothetical protein
MSATERRPLREAPVELQDAMWRDVARFLGPEEAARVRRREERRLGLAGIVLAHVLALAVIVIVFWGHL